MRRRSQQPQANLPISQRQLLASRYASSRHNILLVLAFSLINILLLVTNSNRYFLFSAYLPYFAADLGMYLTDSYPADYYYPGTEFLDKGFLAVMLVIAAIFLATYLLSWIFSKKKVGWMIFSLAFFSLDTVVFLLLNGISVDIIVDIVFHAWVIISLSTGIAAHFKLKKLPQEEAPVPAPEAAEAPLPAASEDKTPEEALPQ